MPMLNAIIQAQQKLMVGSKEWNMNNEPDKEINYMIVHKHPLLKMRILHSRMQ